ncbi:MAG: hypothetical protein NTY67_01375 [Cyanobacteria bacterium]|nr:hypothetical protein [Cyanobacteriota bacterium]
MAHLFRKQEVVSSPFGVPEFKAEWERSPIPHPVAYTRQTKIVAYAEFCGPEEIINVSWGDIRDYAIRAGGVAAVAAIIANPPAALPAFKAAFAACVGEKAFQIQVALSTEQKSGDWHEVKPTTAAWAPL